MKWDGVNRRRHLRVEFPFTIHIHTPQGQTISTYTENISLGGVKVVIKDKLEKSSVVSLEIFTQKQPVCCKGKIMWVTRRDSEFLEQVTLFEIGIELCDIKDEDKRIIEQKADESQKRQHSKNR